ncbi:anti-virulence regulator CigR family protein [Thalassobaculum sp. OXR-137]|uniref:anti-virulence regulator CigR family protein n=1 Tax=Thalassobaculum sp. OXR-137 TaxID=3100173 RepID=UPI002AC93F01|nr:anti-virulence regulator CigR family protein [Thalassobaculum sp. OXR-137]WPZ33051.1 anti-virulence regulator CigR family protein [Thalassobaculum sp. OXR-137]
MAFKSIVLSAVLAAALAAPAFAKNDKAPGNAGNGKPAHAGNPGNQGGGSNSTSDGVAAAAAAGAVLAGILLSDQERSTITRYFQTHPQPVTSLPPGIAKNLARGKPLPPGIAKKAAPNDLLRQLTIPRGYTLETVGTDVVLIEIGTRIVADLLKDVIRN